MISACKLIHKLAYLSLLFLKQSFCPVQCLTSALTTQLAQVICSKSLSKLNFHTFKHSLKDAVNPTCPMNGGIEDTEHFYCFAFHLTFNEIFSLEFQNFYNHLSYGNEENSNNLHPKNRSACVISNFRLTPHNHYLLFSVCL